MNEYDIKIEYNKGAVVHYVDTIVQTKNGDVNLEIPMNKPSCEISIECYYDVGNITNGWNIDQVTELLAKMNLNYEMVEIDGKRVQIERR